MKRRWVPIHPCEINIKRPIPLRAVKEHIYKMEVEEEMIVEWEPMLQDFSLIALQIIKDNTNIARSYKCMTPHTRCPICGFPMQRKECIDCGWGSPGWYWNKIL